MTELRVKSFKDSQGRTKRQAARFQVWAYDDESPQGRPLKLGDQIEGGGNAGVLIDIQWRVYLGNKNSSWYQFLELRGEHGYDPNHPRRNAAITDDNARQQLIIDPGHARLIIRARGRRNAIRQRRLRGDVSTRAETKFDRYARRFAHDDTGRLLVLGGYGNSAHSCLTISASPASTAL